jgi:SAM-dependent methyltransferase
MPHIFCVFKSILDELKINSTKWNVYIYNKKKLKCTNCILKINNEMIKKIFGIIENIHFQTSNTMNIINIVISEKNITFKNNVHKISNIVQFVETFEKVFENPEFFHENVLFMLENKFNINNIFCFPNMKIVNNKIIVFNNNVINEYYKKIQTHIKKYNFNISLDELKQKIQMCNIMGFDIYKGNPEKCEDTEIIKKFHLDVKRQLYKKYCNNIENLFDVGCGRLTDLFFWNENNIDNVYCIEPSIDSIKFGQERLKNAKSKTNIKTKIHVINGIGDEKWNNLEQYKNITEKKYDIITFQFTIHYMIDNIDILMKNINNISKQNTKILITCMNGTLIKNELQKNNKIEIINSNNEIIFAINKFNDDTLNNVLVYFKGGYGMENGSIEKLVDIEKLIHIFNDNNYEIIDKKPFLNFDSKIKNNMNSIQKNVSKYYISIVFIKK